MAIDAAKIEPEHQGFLDNHFSIAPNWDDFRKNLKDKSFTNAVIADTRSNDRLKIFAQAISMRDQSKGKVFKAPSDLIKLNIILLKIGSHVPVQIGPIRNLLVVVTVNI